MTQRTIFHFLESSHRLADRSNLPDTYLIGDDFSGLRGYGLAPADGHGITGHERGFVGTEP